MTNEELRDGLARALYDAMVDGINDVDQWEELPEDVQFYWLDQAKAALAYLHQHNDFARSVREVGIKLEGATEIGSREEELAYQLIAMCDAELEKGNG